MQTRKHDAAFPLLVPEPSDEIFETGLTKREYFAAMAMLGLISSGWSSSVPDKAVKMADKLIFELNKSSSNEDQYSEE